MNRILEKRLAAGLTQMQLAHATGMRQGYISKLENGEHTPGYLVTARIAKALGVSVTDLKPEYGEKPNDLIPLDVFVRDMEAHGSKASEVEGSLIRAADYVVRLARSGTLRQLIRATDTLAEVVRECQDQIENRPIRPSGVHLSE